jgi:CRISPR-associated protein Cmr2
VVHFKEDLRFALGQARTAERVAKDAGRDALAIAVCRRSGEHTRAALGWDQAELVQKLVQSFCDGVSDRWAYKLRTELPSLQGRHLPETSRLPWTGVTAEVGRLLERLEFVSPDLRQVYVSQVRQLLEAYRAEMCDRRHQSAAEALEGFVTLSQSASFLARGRDE